MFRFTDASWWGILPSGPSVYGASPDFTREGKSAFQREFLGRSAWHEQAIAWS
jgi:hypothetical protein